MKIQRPKKFRIGTTLEEVIQYLELYLARTLTDITTCLNRLSFEDNFQSMQTEVTIAAGQELAIRHNLGTVPTGMLTLRTTGTGIIDGATAWTEDYIYLQNSSAGSITALIVILR